jgi:hypothetical protein
LLELIFGFAFDELPQLSILRASPHAELNLAGFLVAGVRPLSVA